MSTRTRTTRASRRPARPARRTTTKTTNKTRTTNASLLGSLITINVGGGRGARRRGGLFTRVKRLALTGFAALKGATGPAPAGRGRGSFDQFRQSRPDLFDDDTDQPPDMHDVPDVPDVPDVLDVPEEVVPVGLPVPSRRWDRAPETDRDRRFFDLREAGYQGAIDQDGYAVDADDVRRRFGGGL